MNLWDETGVELRSLRQRTEVVLKEAINQLQLSEQEAEEARRELISTLDRNLDRLLKGLMLVASSAIFWERDRKFFRDRGLKSETAEDLAQHTAEKILAKLFSCWPTANIGAYRSMLRLNLLRDALRKKSRETNRTEFHQRIEDFCDRCHPNIDHELRDDLFAHCSQQQYEILHRKYCGDSWEEIGQSMDLSADEAKEIARRAFPNWDPSRRTRGRRGRRS